jgi:hypothetical protein
MRVSSWQRIDLAGEENVKKGRKREALVDEERRIAK